MHLNSFPFTLIKINFLFEREGGEKDREKGRKSKRMGDLPFVSSFSQILTTTKSGSGKVRSQ